MPATMTDPQTNTSPIFRWHEADLSAAIRHAISAGVVMEDDDYDWPYCPTKGRGAYSRVLLRDGSIIASESQWRSVATDIDAEPPLFFIGVPTCPRP